MPRSNKGPMVSIHGMQVRALHSEVLARSKDVTSQEILHWREEVAAAHRAHNKTTGDLEKAEATIRNQDVELRRLRARISELESR